MASQRSQMSTQHIVESGSGPNELAPELGGSVTARVSEDPPLEKKEKDNVETSPANLTDAADGYPDGGFAAWCVVLGVSEPSVSLPFGSPNEPCARSPRVLFSRRKLHSLG